MMDGWMYVHVIQGWGRLQRHNLPADREISITYCTCDDGWVYVYVCTCTCICDDGWMGVCMIVCICNDGWVYV